MATKYLPSKGARFTKAQAQSLGEVLETIGFHATPQQVVEAARPKASPIHDMFPWNDKLAAESHRVFLARNYVNHLEVVIITESGERTTKAFHSVVIQHGEVAERGYCSLETVVENEELNAQVVRKALAELNYWKSKYAEYKAYPELAGVFAAIESAASRGKRRRAKGKAAVA